jgi:ABC-2 type transport system permease protein
MTPAGGPARPPNLYAARLGLARGWTEFRHYVRSRDDIGWTVFVTVAFVVVLFFQRNSTVEGTSQSLASVVLPGILGMYVGVSGLTGAGGMLAVEREDGTLLRAKAIPHGMVGYLVAKLTLLSLTAAATLLVIFAAGLLLVPELAGAGTAGWLTVLWVFLLGLLATVPWGAVIGSLVRSPNGAFGLTMLPVAGLTTISGIFYPISAMPGWVQGVAQGFPIYWLGLGMRSALLPDSAVAAELGQSWRHLETVGVLGAWAVAGLLLAPVILRRMARRESGSAVEQRRAQAMQRIG